ncbi:MAG: NAD(P)H-dependent oxidoreductase [Clostridium sp.]|uniref:NAD(P)H-dependent oxidoreductase n=1 Tax=Clostridium sp. TaxID=1506 RepID=UPI0030373FCB
MKVALFNGMSTNNEIENMLINSLKNRELTHLKLRDINIGYCRCCGDCGKLGKCVQKDDGIEVVQCYMDNDVIIYLTTIKYGGYSKELKKFIDRLLPIGANKLEVKDGYMIHKIIYNGKRVIVFGVLDEENKESERAFNHLVHANYINMDWKSYNKVILYNKLDKSELEIKVREGLREVIGNE